jgi:hypothetical protein
MPCGVVGRLDRPAVARKVLHLLGEAVDVHAAGLDDVEAVGHALLTPEGVVLGERVEGERPHAGELGVERRVLGRGHAGADEGGSACRRLPGDPQRGRGVGVRGLDDQLHRVSVDAPVGVDLVHRELPALDRVGPELGEGSAGRRDEGHRDRRVVLGVTAARAAAG